jgi:hypothetical protein
VLSKTPQNIQKLADENFKRLKRDPKHPSAVDGGESCDFNARKRMGKPNKHRIGMSVSDADAAEVTMLDKAGQTRVGMLVHDETDTSAIVTADGNGEYTGSLELK